VTATGIYSALNWLYQPADLVQTAWGGALLVKLALVGSVLLLGSAHHIAANPERFTRWQQRLGTGGRLILTLRLEVILVVVLLV
jgi:putative copper export protein